MKAIELSSIPIGNTTESAFYSHDGELLMNEGVLVTDAHIDALKRRHFTTIYIKDAREDDELQRILSKEFTVGDLELEDAKGQAKLQDKKSSESQKSIKVEPKPQTTRAKILERPDLKAIKQGKDGLEQLQKSQQAEALDSKITDAQSSDKPSGPALKDIAKEMKVEERTAQYKSQVTAGYSDAINSVQNTVTMLGNGEKINGSMIRSVVEKFVATFVTDKNILLNISGIKSSNEDYLFNHSLNVCLLSINIAASYGYNREQIVEIGMGALLHDVGMLLIPRELRLKPGRLTEDEWFEVQKHPILGLHLLEEITHLPASVPYVAYQCHERENAKGYPKQRSNRFIHNFAKIVQVADIYEALSSARAYRSPFIPYKAMEVLVKMTRQGFVSGEFVRAFLLYTSLFPVGSIVELSNKCIAKVIKANNTSLTKPIVSVLVSEQGFQLSKEKIFQIDLATETSIQVVKAHPSDYLKNNNLMDGF